MFSFWNDVVVVEINVEFYVCVVFCFFNLTFKCLEFMVEVCVWLFFWIYLQFTYYLWFHVFSHRIPSGFVEGKASKMPSTAVGTNRQNWGKGST